MHNDLNSFKQNPSQKFRKYFINFEKPQKFSKTQKPRSNAWNAWIMKELGSLPVKKYLI